MKLMVSMSADLVVTAAIFCPFNFGVGNHRIVLVDIDNSALFRSLSSIFPPMKMRRLISFNLQAVNSYLQLANEKVIDHKIVYKISKLINERQDLTSNERESFLNKIDD